MKTQFINDEKVSFHNFGTPEGAHKGWMTRRGSAPYDTYAVKAEAASQQARISTQRAQESQRPQDHRFALRDHEAAESAHRRAKISALRSGNRAAVAHHDQMMTRHLTASLDHMKD